MPRRRNAPSSVQRRAERTATAPLRARVATLEAGIDAMGRGGGFASPLASEQQPRRPARQQGRSAQGAPRHYCTRLDERRLEAHVEATEAELLAILDAALARPKQAVTTAAGDVQTFLDKRRRPPARIVAETKSQAILHAWADEPS